VSIFGEAVPNIFVVIAPVGHKCPKAAKTAKGCQIFEPAVFESHWQPLDQGLGELPDF